VFTLDFWDALRGFCRRAGLPEGVLVDLVTTDLDGRRMLTDLERVPSGSGSSRAMWPSGSASNPTGCWLGWRPSWFRTIELLDALARLRAAGVRIAVLSNSRGSDYVRRANSEIGFVMLGGSTWR